MYRSSLPFSTEEFTTITGILAALAFFSTGTTALPSMGLRMMASTFFAKRSSTWFTCVETPVSSPAVTRRNLLPDFSTAAWMELAMAFWKSSLVTVLRLNAIV